MHNLNDLVVSGKVLYLGISDTPAWVVSKANQYARDHGLRQFVVYQGKWNAAMRDVERDIMPMCRDEGMGLIAYGTVGQGRFQTKAAFVEREVNNPGRAGKPPTALEKAVSKVLEILAEDKCTELSCIAIAYCMQKAPYVFPLLGVRKVEHLTVNLGALSMSLSEEDIERIESVSNFDPGFPHTFLSGSMFGTGRPVGVAGPEDVWLNGTMGTIDWVEGPKAITEREKGYKK